MSHAYDLPYLGSVEIEDRLIEYDGPRLYTVRPSNGGRFLALWAKQTSNVSLFWYSAISDLRYRALLRGEIELRDIYAEPETQFVLEASWNEDLEDYIAAAFKRPHELDESALPKAGFRLAKDQAGLPLAQGLVSSANFVAIQLHRFVARLRFDFGREDHEAPASAVAGSVTSLQDVLDAIGQALKGRATERGVIPEEITNETALAFRTVFASSFGVELAAERQSDLFGRSLVSDSFQVLAELLEAEDNLDQLRAVFTKLKGRTAKRYRTLLQSFAEAEADLDIDFSVPTRYGERQITLLRSRLPAIIAALYVVDTEATEIRSFDAELIGHNKRTRAFEIRDIYHDLRYTGKVTGLAVEAARHATLSEIYAVKIAVTREYEPLIEREVEKFELIDLRDSSAKKPIQSSVH